MPRRARHLIPTQLPRRGEVIAACSLLVLFAHLLFAQLTLVLAIAFVGVGKASRWRRWWLTAPAAVGLAWTAVIGPRAAIAGFTAGPDQVLAYLRGVHPLSRLVQAHGAFAEAGSWLPRQFPLALILGAAEAALAGWLDWMHTDEWAVPPSRPGAVAAVRSAVNSRAVRTGALVTRDGLALGVAPETGARVRLGWREAAGGVLVTGAAAEIVMITSFQLVHAALRRRKPVIAVDMTGDGAVARALASVCTANGIPLRILGTGEGHYEPFRQAGPARRLAMTLALLGAGDPSASVASVGPSAPSAPSDSYDGVVPGYLRVVFGLMDAVPADPRTPVLDDVRHLLNPQALQARFRLVPADSPRRGELAELVRASVRTAQADPRPLVSAARQLASGLATSAVDGAAEDGTDLARVVRERSAVLLHAGTSGLARLICADLAALGEDLRRIGVDGDGLIWLHGWDRSSADALGGLVTGGAAAGLPVLVSSTSPAAADLAGMMNAVLIHKLEDSAAAASLAARTGVRMAPGTPDAPVVAAAPTPAAPAVLGAPVGTQELIARPAVPAQALMSLPPGRFVLAVNAPRYRLVHPGQLVPARLPDGAGQ